LATFLTNIQSLRFEALVEIILHTNMFIRKTPIIFAPRDSHRPVSISTYRFSQMRDIPGTPETIIKSSDMKLHEHARRSRWKEGNKIKVRHSFSLSGKKNKRGSSMLLLSHISVVSHFKSFQSSK